MPTTASNMRGARLAQIALEAYFNGRAEFRKGGTKAADLDWSETDIVDLMTDLLILARRKNSDLPALLARVEQHLMAETEPSM